MPSEQSEDQTVTAGHQGRDEDLLLLLCALAVSGWTRRGLCMCVCTWCPAPQGWQCAMAPDSLWARLFLHIYAFPTAHLCSHRPAESLHSQVYGDGKFDYFCAEWILEKLSLCSTERRWAGSTKNQESPALLGQKKGHRVREPGGNRVRWGWFPHWMLKVWSCMVLHYSSPLTFLMWGQDNLLL